MKFWKIPLLLIALFAYAPSAFAYIDCDNVVEFLTDTIKVPRTKGKPGDTVLVPFYTRVDSATGGIFALIRYDKSKLTPAFYPVDPLFPVDTFVRFQLSGDLKKVNDSLSKYYPAEVAQGSLSPFVVQVSQNPFDSGALVAFYQYIQPDSAHPYYFMPRGAGTQFRIPFILNASVPHNDSTRVLFHEVNEFYTVGGISVYTDCRRTDFSQLWVGNPVPNHLARPVTVDGYIVADTAPLPVINVFDATPSTIASGSSATLSWDVTNMDSLRITGGAFSFGSTNPVTATSVSPTTTTTYTLAAWKGAGNVTAQAAVTVTTSLPPPGNTAPVITFNPAGNSYTIDQLVTVSFTVTATDANGDPVTLSASQLPANATFSTATGTGSASQTFTFTPSLLQQGQFTVIFNASDNTGGSSSSAVVIAVNELQDQLFTSSKLGDKPVGGIRGTKQILFPIDLVSKQKVYGVQFDMRYDQNFFTIDSFITTPRTDGFIIYDNIGTTPGVVRVIILDLAQDSIKTLGGDSTAILFAVMSIDSSAIPGNYPVYLESGWESINPDPTFPAFQLVTDSGIIQVDRPGDVNLDGNVNVADPVSMIGYIIGSFPLKPRNFAVADVITNDTVDVFDLVGVINLALGGSISPVAGQPFGDQPANIAFAYNDLTAGSSDVLTVESEMPTSVAGVQLDIAYDPTTMIVGVPRLALDARQFNIVYRDDGRGRMHVLLYFRGGYASTLPPGTSTLLEIPMTAIRDIKQEERKPINLRSAKVSTKESQIVLVSGVTPNVPSSFSLHQNYPNPFNPTTNIEFNINVSDNDLERGKVTLDVFNLLGQRVARLYDGERQPGRFRVEWDGSNSAGGRVSSGVYFYRLQVGKESQTKKMVLVK